MEVVVCRRAGGLSICRRELRGADCRGIGTVRTRRIAKPDEQRDRECDHGYRAERERQASRLLYPPYAVPDRAPPTVSGERPRSLTPRRVALLGSRFPVLWPRLPL